MSIKELLKRNYVIEWLYINLKRRIDNLCSKQYTIVHFKGRGCLRKDIIGKGNVIEIGRGTVLRSVRIHIRGNNNRIIIGENCYIGEGCSIWAEGNDNIIEIGNNSTFTCMCHINAQENGTSIRIGEDAMFSNNVIVRTSDSHPIYDLSTGNRINEAGDVVIGKHVWLAPNTKVMKGAVVADGCIIGSDTTVSKRFQEPNTMIVGRPAKVVKQGVEWTREKLF